MNPLTKTFLLPVIVILFPLISVSCQNIDEKEFVQFVVQPEAELGKSIDFSIHFEEKPDSISTSKDEIRGLELTDNLNTVLNKISESELTDDEDKVIKTFYKFYTYAKATKIGKIDIPILTVICKGKKYKTKPFSINVVDKIKVDSNAVKVVWYSDKTKYTKKDTIKISLYEYSKFSQTTRVQSALKKLDLKGKGNEISVNFEMTMDKLSGILGFEKLIDDKFEIENIDWNMLRDRQSMTVIDNEVYIKTLIIELDLFAKAKCEVEIGPSSYDFSIYKSNTDYFNKFVPNEEGSYTITENGSSFLHVKSNKLKIIVK